MLAHRLPCNPLGWLMLTGGLANATMGLGQEWAVYVSVGHRDLPGATLAGWWSTWPFIVSLAALPLTLLLFPDGRLPSRRWRPVVWLLRVSVYMVLVEVMLTSEPFGWITIIGRCGARGGSRCGSPVAATRQSGTGRTGCR